MKIGDREGGSGDHHCVVKEGDSWGWNPGKEKIKAEVDPTMLWELVGCVPCVGCDGASIEGTGSWPREDAG